MPPTAALVLAAGLGTRFGGRKLVALVAGQPMLQHVLDLAAAADLTPVVVILGGDAAEVRATCKWRDEWVVVNPRPQDGLSTSVQLGLTALVASNARRAMVLLGDQPYLTTEQLDAVLGVSGQIVVPRYGDRPGNPVVLDRFVWPLATTLAGDRGFGQLFRSRPDLVTYVDVLGANPDIDAPEDLDAVNRV